MNTNDPEEMENSSQMLQFFKVIEQEIVDVEESDALVLIMCDANANDGREFLMNDSQDTSLNNLLERQNISLENAEKSCTGTNTRIRDTKSGGEFSVLDTL